MIKATKLCSFPLIERMLYLCHKVKKIESAKDIGNKTDNIGGVSSGTLRFIVESFKAFTLLQDDAGI
jgi:hypothetical protein